MPAPPARHRRTAQRRKEAPTEASWTRLRAGRRPARSGSTSTAYAASHSTQREAPTEARIALLLDKAPRGTAHPRRARGRGILAMVHGRHLYQFLGRNGLQLQNQSGDRPSAKPEFWPRAAQEEGSGRALGLAAPGGQTVPAVASLIEADPSDSKGKDTSALSSGAQKSSWPPSASPLNLQFEHEILS